MSRGANLSIMGLYNNDNSIFDLMAFPDNFTDEQKQTTIENILIDCAELEVLYPNPTVMKNIIAIWSRKEKPYWNRVYQASQAEYNPIENYRRNETETVEDGRTEQHSGQDVNRASGTDTDSRTGTETMNKTGTETTDHDASHRTLIDELTTDTLSGSDQLKKTGTDSDSGSSSSTDTNSGTDTVTNKITGFDSNTLVTHDESDTVHGHVVTNAAQGQNTKTYNTNDKTEYGRVDTTDHDNDIQETHDDTDTLTINTQDQNTLNTLETFVHGKTDTLTHGEKIEHEGTTERSMLAYGNIGVTTSQEMLTQELELAKIIEVIPIIIHSFQDRFCLMVY